VSYIDRLLKGIEPGITGDTAKAVFEKLFTSEMELKN